MKIINPSVELLSITPDAEQLIERCGRVSHDSEAKITETSARKFIQERIEQGHYSVLEHASATFLIVCNRGVSHELVRHRLASFTQLSTRYCEPPGVILPRELEGWASPDLFETYSQLINRGFSRDVARSVLPLCTATRVAVTANFREWRHILGLRTSPKAHPQMREIMEQIREILVAHAPSVFTPEPRTISIPMPDNWGQIRISINSIGGGRIEEDAKDIIERAFSPEWPDIPTVNRLDVLVDILRILKEQDRVNDVKFLCHSPPSNNDESRSWRLFSYDDVQQFLHGMNHLTHDLDQCTVLPLPLLEDMDSPPDPTREIARRMENTNEDS